ncbi:MAG TPA: DUF1592 domain-containing protein [Chthoniobacteraceae bacterium]|nr:DUF1592 domain-containing protein [Chthoniobacteraceae bacterium]
MITRLNLRLSLCAAFFFTALLAHADEKASPPPHPGAAVYAKICADCHGQKGEGVPDECDEPLIGDRSLAALTKRIARTMPDDDPGSLTPDEAAQVAAYIYDAFYSPAAQARLRPPEIELARLTVPQYRTSVADLIAAFRGGFKAPPTGEQGLKGFYSGIELDRPKPKPAETGQVRKKEPVRFDQVDPEIRHAFGAESPNPCTMGSEQFSIRWEGSVFAEETGSYEFVLRTENGARLWLNNLNIKLIDGWVTSGPNVRDEKKSVFLLGGRAYPLRLEFFKYKDKSASIELLWKPPHGALQTIPARFLSPRQLPPTMVVSTNFPPDDRSVGYERGTGISKEWQLAALDAAIAVAEHVEQNLPELSGARGDAREQIEKLKEFARRFLQTAFRRPLIPEEECAVETQFDEAKTPETALRRIVLFALQSPHFLYPELRERAQPDDYTIAARLALALWDSLPDQELLAAAAAGKLHSRDDIVAQARRMLPDQRTKTKLAGFFHHWLDLARAESIAKDPAAFPGFDEALVGDLRTSLNLFIDQVVWSERSDYRELLGANYLLLNPRLSKFYGKGEVRSGFQRVAFDPKERAGVITHPYLMSSLAHAKLTSPIHRGVFLTRNVLGLSLKSPAMAVVFEDSKFDPSLTMREKITALTRDTSCMGCHAVINPLGFALEQYDAVGRWRTEDNKKPVNPAADLHTDEGDTVRLHGARDIADLAGRSETGQRAFIRHLFHHTVKQEPVAVGPDTMNLLLRSFVASEFNIQKLLTEIAVAAASRGLPDKDASLVLK